MYNIYSPERGIDIGLDLFSLSAAEAHSQKKYHSILWLVLLMDQAMFKYVLGEMSVLAGLQVFLQALLSLAGDSTFIDF